MSDLITSVKNYLLSLQQKLCQQFEQVDGRACFLKDVWTKAPGNLLSGGGITCVLENGATFEQVGVNFSHVYGEKLPASAQASRSNIADKPFEALGVSLVVHPRNPYIPTSHANVRFFMAGEPGKNPVWWYGGGYDLTPYYGFTEDCQHWHTIAKAACDPFGKEIYPELKRWCDDYFYLKHRKEQRGIGGLFFDDWAKWDWETCFSFMKSVGDSYANAYFPIVEKRKLTPYGERERKFQLIRRGRYVEFNLLYDRGTLFGLQSEGRTESILMSLPPEVSWRYNHMPEPASLEAELLTNFLVPKDWVTNA